MACLGQGGRKQGAALDVGGTPRKRRPRIGHIGQGTRSYSISNEQGSKKETSRGGSKEQASRGPIQNRHTSQLGPRVKVKLTRKSQKEEWDREESGESRGDIFESLLKHHRRK